MYVADPDAEAFLLCQDDVLLSRGLRGYLEDSLWPVPDPGVISVYCPSHYAQESSPGFHAVDLGGGTWGALAWVIPNASVQLMLTHPLLLEHRAAGVNRGERNVDSIVGLWCQLSGRPYLVHSPSLGQHIGETSTLWTSGAVGRRRATDFLEDATGLNAQNNGDNRRSDHPRPDLTEATLSPD